MTLYVGVGHLTGVILCYFISTSLPAPGNPFEDEDDRSVGRQSNTNVDIELHLNAHRHHVI